MLRRLRCWARSRTASRGAHTSSKITRHASATALAASRSQCRIRHGWVRARVARGMRSQIVRVTDAFGLLCTRSRLSAGKQVAAALQEHDMKQSTYTFRWDEDIRLVPHAGTERVLLSEAPSTELGLLLDELSLRLISVRSALPLLRPRRCCAARAISDWSCFVHVRWMAADAFDALSVHALGPGWPLSC